MKYKSYSACDRQGQTQIKEIYEKSFPENEKFPFWLLKQCAKENNVRLDAIIDHSTDKIVGMKFLVSYDDITYLMYMAIEENCRNKGFGSLVLRDLLLCQLETTALLCIEKPGTELKDEKARRQDFYLRNGFYETGCFIEDSGVKYELLSSTKDYCPTNETLDKRYSRMSKNPFTKWASFFIFFLYQSTSFLLHILLHFFLTDSSSIFQKFNSSFCYLITITTYNCPSRHTC